MLVLSLGAGVQSTTLALMGENGEVEKPDFAVFADTGWEPKAVYAHLDWLETQLSFPVHRTSAGDLRGTITENKTGHTEVPFFTVRGGMGKRQCTTNYKIRPIRRKVREHLPKGETVRMQIGISLDEFIRMKPSRVQYIENCWPLVDMGITRDDCKEWMRRNHYPMPPRSSCLGCPFHADAEWRYIRDNAPEEWAATCDLDDHLRATGRFNHQQYMHRTMKPLRDVDLRTMEERGQLTFWNDECEGMCGV